MWALWMLPAFGNIVNGSIEPDFPATVALGAQFGEVVFSACTGTLITPRIILSAAHCGSDLPPELIVQAGKAFFGTDVENPELVMGFTEVVIHQEYVPLQNGLIPTYGENDVSLLVLEADAPVDPVMIWTEEMTDSWLGREIFSIGFGITGANQDDAGVKRSAPLVVSDLMEQFVIVDNADTHNLSNICSGDSGGSQMYFHPEWQEWVQIAIHSWGDDTCTQTSGSVRTDLVAAWVMETVERIHGTTDYCEINGRYEDGECTVLPICEQADPECVVEEEPKMACSSLTLMDGIWWIGLLGLRRKT